MNSVNDPLEKSGAYSPEGSPAYSVACLRLLLARFPSRLGRSRRPGKATGPHIHPATAAKLIPRGNGMPVIASPHRSPLSVPAVDHPPC